MFCDESASVIEKANRSIAASTRSGSLSSARSGSLSSASSSRPAKKSESPPAREKRKAVETSMTSRPKRVPDLDSDFIGEIFGNFGDDDSSNPFSSMADAAQADMKYLNQYCKSGTVMRLFAQTFFT